VARVEAYLRAKFHLDPSNRLATVDQRYRQTGQTDGQTDKTTALSDSIRRTVLQTVAQKDALRYDQRSISRWWCRSTSVSWYLSIVKSKPVDLLT